MMDNMKYFEEFSIDLMIESLNDPYEIKWVEKSEFIYIANFCNDKFLIHIDDIGKNGCWFFKFYRFDEELQNYTDMSNLKNNINQYGESTKILGTIRKAFIDFMEMKKPNGIYFIAYDDSKSRKSIYDLFCNQIEIKYNHLYRKYTFFDDENHTILYCLSINKHFVISMRKTVYEKWKILF